MLDFIISFLVAILIVIIFGNTIIFGQSLKNETETAKVKTELNKRGIGEKAKVKIERHDGSEVKGYIAGLNAEDFVIADSKTNSRTTILYSDVAKVKKQGWSLGAKLAIAGAVLGGIVIAAAANRGIDCALCP